jgi:hypothetical protein
VLSFTVSAPAPPPPPPPPPPATDQTAPSLRVFAAHGLLGQAVRLRFSIHDNSGKAELVLGVYRAGKSRPVATHHYALQPLSGIYYTTWRPRARGSYRFCVIAQDAIGNRSPVRCAAVTIRK